MAGGGDIALLLQDGRRFDQPSADQLQLAESLERQGLIRVEHTQTFRCVDWDNDADLALAHDPSCPGVLPYLGACEHTCESCGRSHWPDQLHKTLRPRLRVWVQGEGIQAWMDALLHRSGLQVTRAPSAPIWRVTRGFSEVILCLPDLLPVGASIPFGHVLQIWVDPRRGLAPSGALALADFVEHPERIGSVLAEALGQPMLCAEPVAPRWSVRQVPSTPRRVHERRLGAREVLVASNGVTLDGFPVLTSRARGLIPILSFLVRRWAEDLADGKHPQDFCCFTPAELALELEGGRSPETLKRQLNRLRARLSEGYEKQSGRSLGRSEVVELVPGQGYRLRPEGLVARLV